MPVTHAGRVAERLPDSQVRQEEMLRHAHCRCHCQRQLSVDPGAPSPAAPHRPLILRHPPRAEATIEEAIVPARQLADLTGMGTEVIPNELARPDWSI